MLDLYTGVRCSYLQHGRLRDTVLSALSSQRPQQASTASTHGGEEGDPRVSHGILGGSYGAGCLCSVGAEGTTFCAVYRDTAVKKARVESATPIEIEIMRRRASTDLVRC